jgi:hypothetical protein
LLHAIVWWALNAAACPAASTAAAAELPTAAVTRRHPILPTILPKTLTKGIVETEDWAIAQP